MPVERVAAEGNLVEVLDRVLDKGIVIDAWVRVSLVGIDLITLEARVVVASIETYLKYSEALAETTGASKSAEEGQRRATVTKRVPTARRTRFRQPAQPQHPHVGPDSSA